MYFYIINLHLWTDFNQLHFCFFLLRAFSMIGHCHDVLKLEPSKNENRTTRFLKPSLQKLVKNQHPISLNKSRKKWYSQLWYFVITVSLLSNNNAWRLSYQFGMISDIMPNWCGLRLPWLFWRCRLAIAKVSKNLRRDFSSLKMKKKNFSYFTIQ